MTNWQWQQWQDASYLTCNLLERWQHGFFTRQFWPQTPEELTQILQPSARMYRVKQVHGNRVLAPAEIEIDRERDSFPPADGLVTDRAHQAVWVASADCTPVLIGDVETGRAAAVHAGWRGTAKKIVPEAIARFLDFGSSIENLRVALGPAIDGRVYQVSLEVAAEVGSTILSPEPGRSVEQAIATLQNWSDPPLWADIEPGKARLDVRSINYFQLAQLGVAEDQIAIAPYCTYQTPNSFFSYRRTQEKKVQWSGITSRE